ncbi:MAG TPA: hypothetical protein VIM71_16280 [Lacunisphaera sp.]
MKPIHQVFFAAGLLVLGAITWQVLTLPKPQARWLAVTAPAQIVLGEKITVQVTVNEPAGGLQLAADLHGWTHRNHALGVVSHAEPKLAAPSAHPVDFSFTVPALADLTTVRAIIYLSPTGSWQDRTRGAMSDEIPIRSAGSSISHTLFPLPAHELVPDPVIPRLESSFLRHLIVGLWLVVAFGLGLQLRRSQPNSPAASRGRVIAPTFMVIVACLTAVLVEVLGAEQNLGDLARQFAVRHDLYEERHLPQQIAVLLSVVGVAAVVAVIIVRARRRRLVCGLLLYAVISIIATLSLHETDAILYATILGQPVEQLVKLVAVALSLWGLRSNLTSAPAAGSG